MKTPIWIKEWRIRRRIQQYQARGQHPWSLGYEEYKEKKIRQVLEKGGFNTEQLPAGYGYRLDERIVEIPWLFSRISSAKARFLDAGSAMNHALYLQQPTLAQKEIHILNLVPEEKCFWNFGVTYMFADLRDLPYRNEWFDEIACISTLEHVGMDNTFLYTTRPAFKENSPETVLAALRELYRVLKPGGRLWISVPVGKPANLGWLQVFSPESFLESIHILSPASVDCWYYAYGSDGWLKTEPAQIKTAGYFDWHRTKVYDSDYAAAAKAVCCLELIKSK